MSKLKSRKLWAWIIWTILTGAVLVFSPDSIAIALPLYGIITGAYLGIQGVIDAMSIRGGK